MYRISINWKSFIYGVVAGITFVSVFYIHQPKKSYVYVDIGRVIGHITNAVVQENPTRIQTRIDSYKVQFKKLIRQYAKNNHVVVFSSPKPISGAKDVTDWFIEHLNISEKTNIREPLTVKGEDFDTESTTKVELLEGSDEKH